MSDKPSRPLEGTDGASLWPSVRVGGELGLALKEWLHTNGAGAYASSTLACMHTRRYHGLLVAALDPPRGRHVMLSHVDATVELPDPSGARRARQRWELGKHQFPGIDPEAGPFHLSRFDQDPLPRWTYEVAGGALEISLGLVRGENAVVLRYAWRGPQPVVLTLRPLLAVRHMHQIQRENGAMMNRVELRYGGAGDGGTYSEVRMQPNRALPRLCLRCPGMFVGSPDWWRRFEYLAERDRGMSFHEDLWTPGHVEVKLGDAPVHLVAAVGALPEGDPEALLEAARAAILAEDPGPEAPLLERRLTVAAAAFRCDAGARPGVISGYPWFEVSGRETLMALPGLYLVPGKIEGAMGVLRELIQAMEDGLVPNRLPDAGGPADFQIADATLWLFEAARHMADALGDAHPFVTGELLPALQGAFEAILRGTRNIRVTADGLVAVGRAGEAPTWMHAFVGGRPVTPRVGCPVELSALWSSGAATLSRLARAAGDEALAGRAEEAARRAREAFRARFWCEETSYPYDVISEAPDEKGAFCDATIRPNALIALVVAPGCFTPEQAGALLDRVRLELLTPAGVRSLSPADPAYVPRYRGGIEERDGAYHQGAVWPWLLGFYARAARRSSTLGEHVLPLIRRLVASAAAGELALGFVPELCDAEPPHQPGGCVAHGISVAELLRVVAWDLPR